MFVSMWPRKLGEAPAWIDVSNCFQFFVCVSAIHMLFGISPSYMCFSAFLSLSLCTAHTQSPGEGKPMVRQPGGDSARGSPPEPPVVKVIGGTSPGSQAGPWMLALLSSAALCLQWTLF